MNVRYDMKDTAAGRLSVIASDLCDEIAEGHASTGHGPTRPYAHDFESRFELYIQLELLNRELDVLRRHGTLAEAMLLIGKLNEVKLRIAAREKP